MSKLEKERQRIINGVERRTVMDEGVVNFVFNRCR